MKKRFTLLSFFATIIIFAQAPQGFNYQATVRNSSGALIVNQNVYFKFNVMLNSQTSVPVFTETHFAPTDDLGQVNLVVGTGTATAGTFSTINWGSGSYYLGIELNTGSGYTAMGTTQLLSVPYALYANNAGSTQTNSKTSIYLTGNITNAQAVAKLAIELGPDTENIYIRNTTQLTTVNLSSLVTAVKISIENNVALANVNLNGLTTVFETFDVSKNPSLNLSIPLLSDCYELRIDNISSVNLTSLLHSSYLIVAEINNLTMFSNIISSDYIYIKSINNLSSLNFQSLVSIEYLGILENPALTSIVLPASTSGSSVYIDLNPILTSVSLPVFSSGSIDFNGNASLTSVSLPVFSSGSIGFYSNASLTSIALPVFSSGSVYIDNNNTLRNFSFPNLNGSVLDQITVSKNPLLTSVSFPALTTCNIFNIHDSPLLTSVSLPALTNCNELAINSNPLLTSIAIPVINSGIDFRFYYNALSTSTINLLLNKMLTVSSAINKQVYLHGQNPPAPPTGQGILDKQTLISAGNNVQTD